MGAVEMIGTRQITRSATPTAGAAGADADGSGRAREDWRRALVAGLVAYLASRVLVGVGVWIAAAGRPGGDTRNAALAAVLRAWDGEWYLSVVRDGYPRQVPADLDSVGRWEEARVGFFPLYPAAVRTLDRVLPGDALVAAWVLGLVVGALVVYLVGLLAREWFGPLVASRAMVLTALLPGSFVFTFVYSEGLLLALAAGGLLALHRHHWWSAGALAALATATRPNGIALAVACAVAAFEAIRRRHEWRSLVAPLLAPVGFLGYHAFLRLHTGEAWVWFRVQEQVWEEHFTYGASTAWQVRHFVTGAGGSWEDFLTTATVVATVVLCALAWRFRLPWPALAYSWVVVALMVLPSTVTARPRFLYTAFPLVIALARWWPDDSTAWARRGWWALLATSGVALVGVTILYGGYDAVP